MHGDGKAKMKGLAMCLQSRENLLYPILEKSEKPPKHGKLFVFWQQQSSAGEKDFFVFKYNSCEITCAIDFPNKTTPKNLFSIQSHNFCILYVMQVETAPFFSHSKPSKMAILSPYPKGTFCLNRLIHARRTLFHTIKVQFQQSNLTLSFCKTYLFSKISAIRSQAKPSP